VVRFARGGGNQHGDSKGGAGFLRRRILGATGGQTTLKQKRVFVPARRWSWYVSGPSCTWRAAAQGEWRKEARLQTSRHTPTPHAPPHTPTHTHPPPPPLFLIIAAASAQVTSAPAHSRRVPRRQWRGRMTCRTRLRASPGIRDSRCASRGIEGLTNSSCSRRPRTQSRASRPKSKTSSAYPRTSSGFGWRGGLS
jgi:hypothetical protein